MTRVEFVYYTFLASVGLYIIAGMIGIYFGDPFQLTRAYDPDSTLIFHHRHALRR